MCYLIMPERKLEETLFKAEDAADKIAKELVN